MKIYDEGWPDGEVRDLTKPEEGAYHQALRTISQWMGQEHDFVDSERPAAWQAKPSGEGAYLYCPGGAQILAGGIIVVFGQLIADAHGVARSVLHMTGGRATEPLDEFCSRSSGWWFGPVPLPPTSVPKLPPLPPISQLTQQMQQQSQTDAQPDAVEQAAPDEAD
jgi:hypothetical protein